MPRGDRDVPLMLCDRPFEEDGSFRYPAHDGHDSHGAFPDGVLGDVQLVNGAPWPALDVSATRYRFRLLNASNARRYRLRLDAGDGKWGRFVQIGSDGGLLAAPRPLDAVDMAPGERFDVIVDFSAFPVGGEVTLRNSAAVGGMRDVMRFRVVRREKDDSRVPDRLSASFEVLSPSGTMPVRAFDFRRTHSTNERQMWTINGRPFSTDTVLASPRLPGPAQRVPHCTLSGTTTPRIWPGWSPNTARGSSWSTRSTAPTAASARSPTSRGAPLPPAASWWSTSRTHWAPTDRTAPES
ncbi:hypothetical protein GCM10020000_78420 [Streptomyces olivoverticillatus]